MRLKMRLDMVKAWWKPDTGTVSMWDLIMAQLQVKLCRGLTFILSPVDKAMLKIRSVVSVTQYRAKETISLRTIEQIKPVKVTWTTSPGFIAQPISSMPYVANTPAFTFNNSNSKPILIITKDGDVEWHGKPSEAASIMVSSFQFAVEEQKGVTKAARRRYYYKACKNILNKAEKMEHKDFVDFLQKQVYNKERTIILDGLKGN